MTNMNNFAEKVQALIEGLDWESAPSTASDESAVLSWQNASMGPNKRKSAARILGIACHLAHVALPRWAA